MIAFPAGTKVWIAGGVTDMRCGRSSLAIKVQAGLGSDPFCGEFFCLRGRKAGQIKILWHDGVGMSLHVTRLEAGRFVWPRAGTGGALAIPVAQMGYLLEGEAGSGNSPVDCLPPT